MADAAHIRDEDLPPIVVEIRELIGLDATLALVRAYGGTPVYIPERYDPEHELAAVVGHAGAVELVRRFARERIYMPKCCQALQVRRNIEISRRYEHGVTVQRLARDYNLSTRQIWSILKRPETVRPSPQQALFPGD